MTRTGRFDAGPAKLDALAEALRPWDDVGIGTVGPARGDVSAVETENEETRARCRGWSSYLRSTQDPSLLVAEQAWNDDGLRRWTGRRSCC